MGRQSVSKADFRAIAVGPPINAVLQSYRQHPADSVLEPPASGRVRIMASERRRHRRHATDHTAHVKFPIRLVDVWQSGAQISVDRNTNLPAEFVLMINASLARWCRVKWRKGEQVGIEFFGPGDPPPKALNL